MTLAASGSDHAKLSQILNPHSSKSLQLKWLSLQQEQQSAGNPAPSSFRARARLREQHTTSTEQDAELCGCKLAASRTRARVRLRELAATRVQLSVKPGRHPSEPPCYRNDAWAWVSAWAWVGLG